MAKVLAVESGQILLQVSPSDTIETVLRLTAEALDNAQESDILLFGSDGRRAEKGLVGEFAQDGEELFAAFRRKMRFECDTLAEKSDWQTFAHFPQHDAYEESFPFDATETAWDDSLVEDEKLMFSLCLRARRAYALYRINLCRYAREAERAEIRAKAGPVLLRQVKRYRKQVKDEFSVVQDRLETLKRETLADANSFKQRLLALTESEQLAPYVQQLLRDPSFKHFGKTFAASLRILEAKLSEIDTLLDDSKQSLRDRSARSKFRLSSLSKVLTAYYSSDSLTKEPVLASCLEVCKDYRSLRVALYQSIRSGSEEIEVGEIVDRMDEWQDRVEAGERVLISLQEWGRRVLEESLKVANSLSETTSLCSIQSQKLNFRGLERLQKIAKKAAKLSANRSILSFPSQFAVSCSAAVEETERRRCANRRLAEMYAELCHHVVTEEQRRTEFFRVHGETLPKTVFAELETEGVQRGVMRHILRVEETLGDEEEAKKLAGEDDRFKGTIDFYQSELASAEAHRVSDLSALQSKYYSLIKSRKDLAVHLSRLNSEKADMQSLLQSYQVELALLQEEATNREPHLLKSEIEKLQKKEAVFKKSWIEQAQSLEAEVKLLKARERKKSRADVSELQGL